MIIDSSKEYIACSALHYDNGRKYHFMEGYGVKSGFVIGGLRHPFIMSVLPENVANVVKSTYSDAIMIDVEKIGKNYKIELNNNVKMTIRPDGKIIRHRLDD